MSSLPIGRTSRRCLHAKPRRLGFTLIELLVVVSVIALLIGILLPALGAARQSAQLVACKSNLRQFMTAMNSYGSSADGYFCSGAWDNRQAYSWGPLDKAGWVADMVNGEYALPGQMLSPSGVAETTQTWSTSKLTGNGQPVWDAQLVADLDRRADMLRRGYNTNYCLHWYAAHYAMKTPYKTSFPGGVDGEKLRANTQGPLRLDRIFATTPSRVPLMGNATAMEDNDDDWVVWFGTRTASGKSMTDGPKGQSRRLSQATLFFWGRQGLGDIGMAHGKGEPVTDPDSNVRHHHNRANLAMADGSVTTFSDTVRDGRLSFAAGVGPQGQVQGDWQFVPYGDGLEGKVFGGDLSGAGLAY